MKWICHNLSIFGLCNNVAHWHMNLVVFVPVWGPPRKWYRESKQLAAKHVPEPQIYRMSCLRHSGTVQHQHCEQPCGQTDIRWQSSCLVLQEGKRHTSVILPSAGCGLLWTWWLCDPFLLLALNLERHHWFSFHHVCCSPVCIQCEKVAEPAEGLH